MRFAEARAAGDFERERRRIHVVVLAVEEARLEVDDLIPRDLALLALGHDRVLHGRDEFARDAPAGHLVGPLHAAAVGERLEHHLDLGELP